MADECTLVLNWTGCSSLYVGIPCDNEEDYSVAYVSVELCKARTPLLMQLVIQQGHVHVTGSLQKVRVSSVSPDDDLSEGFFVAAREKYTSALIQYLPRSAHEPVLQALPLLEHSIVEENGKLMHIHLKQIANSICQLLLSPICFTSASSECIIQDEQNARQDLFNKFSIFPCAFLLASRLIHLAHLLAVGLGQTEWFGIYEHLRSAIQHSLGISTHSKSRQDIYERKRSTFLVAVSETRCGVAADIPTVSTPFRIGGNSSRTSEINRLISVHIRPVILAMCYLMDLQDPEHVNGAIQQVSLQSLQHLQIIHERTRRALTDWMNAYIAVYTAMCDYNDMLCIFWYVEHMHSKAKTDVMAYTESDLYNMAFTQKIIMRHKAILLHLQMLLNFYSMCGIYSENIRHYMSRSLLGMAVVFHV